MKNHHCKWTIIVLVTLAAVAVGGDAPQRIAAPPAAVAEASDWCAGHAVPESKCTKCNPGLIAQFKAAGDWCEAHGFPESVCPLCNPAPPAAVAEASDWCAGHAVPESKCTKCNPGLIAQFEAAGDWCEGHGFPESVCPFCNPVPPPAGMPEAGAVAPGTRIRFRAPEIENAAGIEVEPARAAALDITVECTARIDFDRNRLADIRAAVPGVVREVLVDMGAEVDEGERLFVLESPRVGELQGRLRSVRQRAEVARANHERQRELREAQIASARQLELARQEREAAEAELRSLESSLRIVGGAGAGQAGRYELASPIRGTVVRRPATLGAFASEEVSLATVTDTRTMWALLDVREPDLAALRIGQPVSVRVDGIPERVFDGEITWIAAEVDPHTRTVAARAEVENPDGLLRAQQFARATIRVAAPSEGVAVPREAVQRLGDDAVVFVRTGAGLYEPRVVHPGRADESRVQVRGPVEPGDLIVTEGAFLLKTELSKDDIGAGCCEVEPPGAER